MEKVTECAMCAWRKDCKIKFSYEGKGLYCREFTRDLSIKTGKPPLKAVEDPAEKKKKTGAV